MNRSYKKESPGKMKNKGFTLIELMVIIVIIGILAAVIAPRIPLFVAKAKESKKISEMKDKGYSERDIQKEVAKMAAEISGDLILQSKTEETWFTVYKYRDKMNNRCVYVVEGSNQRTPVAITAQ